MIDKSWIDKPIRSKEFLNGVLQFLDFAFSSKAAIDGKIWCPCISCNFGHMANRTEVFSHLLEKGFPTKYTSWYMHGEKHVQSNVESVSQANEESIRQYPMQDMLNDIFGGSADHGIQDSQSPNLPNSDHPTSTRDVSNEEREKIKELLEDGNQELYQGCTSYSKLSFIVRLYHIKVLCGATDKTFSLIIELLNDAFPHAKLPSSFYEAKKVIKKLGLSYDKIHACPNNCMLYWGSLEDERRDKCKFCNKSRWKSNENDVGINDVTNDKKKKKPQPEKVLRYFPLIPRLQRLYMCSKTAELLKWHGVAGNPDGLLRHPRDSKAWKEFDSLYPNFASDPRNVRLALATDGFNPYGTLSSTNSIWPVMLFLYNYPPWCCMKQTSLIMSMIIPGPKMPGNKIDVYLQPLVAELKKLWDGVDAYDSSADQMFQMRAALFCTISDFPGLDNLSGWNTHTLFACPSCKFDTDSKRLRFGRKNCFMGHRRYLPLGHKYRYNKQSFDGSVELRLAPIPMSGSDMLKQVEDSRKRPRDEGTSNDGPLQWKKRSIFWDLPYWEHNLIRHCLDMMHIEKNVCDNVLFTVLDDKRTKDNLQARKDLQEMGIRERLHPYPNSSKFPQSCFKLKNMEKDVFLKILKNVVFPDSYASNISRCVDIKKRKVSGLKSHDSHILVEHLLPIAFRKTLPKEVASVLIELCNYFREISCKVLDVKNIEKLQQRIALTLCHMEMIFPPSFFTIMVHLVIHLGEEAMIAGPVHYRWMYPVERTLGHLKSYVRNKAAPEGCIAEGYIMEECLTFCSRYLEDSDIETRFNRPRRNDDDNEVSASSESTILSNLFPASGRPIGAIKIVSLSPLEMIQAHRYVLTNCELVDAFREKCKTEVTRMHRGKRNPSRIVEEYIHKHFHEWFREYVARNDDPNITAEIEWLAKGPNNIARRFDGYNIHGFKFRTDRKDQGLRTQNSGVVMSAITQRYSIGREPIEKSSNDMYYGKLVDIIELDYFGKLRVVLFKCIWVDTKLNKGIKIDQFGITSVNFSRLIHTGVNEVDEPFILAADARMVYYVDDPVDQGWSCVCHMKPRDIYDMGDVNLMDSEETILEDIPFCEQNVENIEELQLVQDDVNEQEQDETNFDDDHDSCSDGEDRTMLE